MIPPAAARVCTAPWRDQLVGGLHWRRPRRRPVVGRLTAHVRIRVQPAQHTYRGDTARIRPDDPELRSACAPYHAGRTSTTAEANEWHDDGRRIHSLMPSANSHCHLGAGWRADSYSKGGLGGGRYGGARSCAPTECLAPRRRVSSALSARRQALSRLERERGWGLARRAGHRMGLVGHTPARFAAAGHAAARSTLANRGSHSPKHPRDEMRRDGSITPPCVCARESARERRRRTVTSQQCVGFAPAMRGARLGRDCVAAV